MIRSAASKVMWVGRATVFFVGLAVILALLFGVASTALGKNGNPFILGKAANTATKVTGLVGKIADTTKAALSVNNTRGGPALELKVGNPTATPPIQPNDVAPMTVNSTKRVDNLNADELDGVNSTGFLQNGAAAGGDLSGTYPNPQIANGAVAGGLGGKIADNTVDHNDIATGAVDSDELNDQLDNTINADDIATSGVGTDEINSTQVQRRVSGSCPAGSSIRSVAQDGTVVCESDGITGREIVETSTAFNTTGSKQGSASCPSGKIAMSGGAQYSIDADSNLISSSADIALQRSAPFSTNTWAATADYVGGGTAPEWRLITFVVCINT